MNIRKYIILSITALMLCAANCEFTKTGGQEGTGPDQAVENTENPGTVKLRLPDGKRKGLAPLPCTTEFNSPSCIKEYEATLTCGALGYTNTKAGAPGGDIVFNNLFEGTYQLELKGLDETGDAIYGGTKPGIQVKPRQTTNVRIKIKCLKKCVSNCDKRPCYPNSCLTLLYGDAHCKSDCNK